MYKKLLLAGAILGFVIGVEAMELPVDYATLDLSLEGKSYKLPLDYVLKHIASCYPSVDKETQEPIISGYHQCVCPSESVENAYAGKILKPRAHVWVFTQEPEYTTKCSVGYCIYKGKEYVRPKTFFPSSWNRSILVKNIKEAFKQGTLLITSSVQHHTGKKQYDITVTCAPSAPIPALRLIVNGYPDVPESMHIVTLYPLVPIPDYCSANLRTIAQDQERAFKELNSHAVAQKNSSNVYYPHIINALKEHAYLKLTGLLEAGIDPDCTDKNGQTPLMFAAQCADYEAINILLEHGASKSKSDAAGKPVLLYALESFDPLSVLAFIDSDSVNKTYKDMTPLIYTIKHPWQPQLSGSKQLVPLLECIEILLHFGAIPNQGCTLLTGLKAVNNAQDIPVYAKIITTLLNYGADPDAQDSSGTSALIYAASDQRLLPLAQLLIERGANFSLTNRRGQCALTLLQKHPAPQAAELVAQCQKQEQEKKEWLKHNTELMYAIAHGHKSKALALLPTLSIETIRAVNNEGLSALEFALDADDHELVQELLSAGADALVGNKYAQERPSIDAALKKLLHDHAGVIITEQRVKQEKERHMQLALRKEHLTAFNNDVQHDKLTQQTLAHLKIYNLQNTVLSTKSKFTPLLYAVKEGKRTVVKQLLELGVNVQIRDAQERDCLCIAYDNNDMPMLTLLLEEGIRNQKSFQKIFEHIFAHSQPNQELILLCYKHAPNYIVSLLAQWLVAKCPQGQILFDRVPLSMSDAYACALTLIAQPEAPSLDILLKRYPSLIHYANAQGQTLLMLAVQAGLAKPVECLLACGALLDSRDHSGRTCFDYTHAKSDVFTRLYDEQRKRHQREAELREKQEKKQKEVQLKVAGYTDLMIAACLNQVAAIEADTSNVNATNGQGMTALMVAAQEGNSAAVTALLRKPSLVLSRTDHAGNTALSYAQKAKHAVVCALLTPKQPEVKKEIADKQKQNSLVDRVIESLKVLEQQCVAQGFNFDVCTKVINKALAEKHILGQPLGAPDCNRLVGTLLKQGHPIACILAYILPGFAGKITAQTRKEMGSYLLLSPDYCLLLLCKPSLQRLEDAQLHTLMEYLLTNSVTNSAALSLLLTCLIEQHRTLDPVFLAKTILEVAIRDLNVDLVALALKAGAKSNFWDDKHEYPLIKALQAPYVAAANVHELTQRQEKAADIIADLLIDGADPNVGDSKGRCALEIAINLRFYQAVSLLLECGVKTLRLIPLKADLATQERVTVKLNLALVDAHHNTFIMQALKAANPTLALDLIKKGAPFDTVNTEGTSALSLACAKGYHNVAQELIKRGATIADKDVLGLLERAIATQDSVLAQTVVRSKRLPVDTQLGAEVFSLMVERNQVQFVQWIKRSHRYFNLPCIHVTADTQVGQDSTPLCPVHENTARVCKLKQCGHTFKVHCLASLLVNALSADKLNTIRCPVCYKPLCLEDLQRVAPHPRLIELMGFMIKRKRIARDPQGKFCPTSGCTSMFINDKPNNPVTVQCGKCKQTYCCNCLKAHTEGQPCASKT